MIKDNIKNAKLYYGISDRIKKGLEWIINSDLKSINDGRYEISGNDIYANVQTYITKDDAKYEAHRDYIDIQYMINGKENIGFASVENCKTSTEYDKEKDLEFFDNNNKDEYLQLNENEFMVFFPTDAHKPSIKYNYNDTVKKVVVKVKVN